MRAGFGGFEVARKAMNANRVGVEVASNNIANAGTAGYTRRTVQFEPSVSVELTTSNGSRTQLGTGVDVSAISREWSKTADEGVRSATASSSGSDIALGSAEGIESVFNEPSDSGLSAVLSSFWSAWNDVSVNPEDAGVRSTLLEKGKDVALTVNRMATQLDAAKTGAVSSMYADTSKLNGLIDQLTKVNESLSGSREELTEPSDLLDERDAILGEMSKLVDVGVTYNSDRTASVTAGGRWVVDHTTSSHIWPTKNDDGTYKMSTDGGDELSAKGGSLGGHLTAVNVTYPTFRSQFNGVVAELRDKVNALHKAGYTDPGDADVSTLTPSGVAFFKEPAAGADPALSLEVALTSQTQIAANGVEGDPPTAVKYGAAALAVSQLNVSGTITSGYASLVSAVGSAVDTAQRNKDIDDAALEQQQNMRDEVSGVNTEEEMLDILKYEAGYNAAAKIATIVDEMMKTIMSIAS